MQRLLFLLLFLLIGINPAVASISLPSFDGPIIDQEKLLSAKSFDLFDSALRGFYQQTGIQLQVLTTDSLQGLTVEEFSLAAVEQWKLGKKGDDRGVLLLVSKKDRALRIEVGTGLEGDLPDALVGRVVDNMIPYFRNGNFQDGIILGANAIAETLGTPLALKDFHRQARNSKRQAGAGTLLTILILLSVFGRSFFPIAAIAMGGSARSRSYGSWGGGSGGWSSGRGSWSGGGGGFSGGGASGHW